jgi:hypothetical protein
LVGLATRLGLTVLVAQVLLHLRAHGALYHCLLQSPKDRLELALGDRTGDQLIQQFLGNLRLSGGLVGTLDFFFLGISAPCRS